MYPVNKKDIATERTRKQIKLQVDRLKSLSKTDEQIVKFLEDDVEKELGLSNYFDSVHELADYIEIPVSKFRVFWM
ncbi:hypothetical protein [Bacillus atrophaeus]|uniref:Uncharacterized protein n=1 Tax=Bacillus atrophaeus (strain 1942) TaxID=720555 RepID=A0ABM5LX92_BACA1|nr:hypothetical protein [Bacillus atrophaeus]AMR62649.1 hypothetical protein A1D11_09625 [Bacillus subtilis subsp. globigii]ADP32499.1 hypothetical protein BATR1942_07800 [Bacillus atrophaeus 1942]AIK49321.1 hypothetical protein DJ95_1457 [Bacillus atrophaeus subsp. globigii]EIM11703.1 hypothetical protein UY9_05562 [Bacillus atrophaeus C89]KFK83120.1 hypothetical protein DK44_2178 [Bacillus atrophaeus]